MFEKTKNWLKTRFYEDELPESESHRTAAHTIARPKPSPAKPAARSTVTQQPSKPAIENTGPGENVLIRNKYLREDTGTHETLKILDDSIVDSGEEPGIDPYNTGSFDRSKNWNNRFHRK